MSIRTRLSAFMFAALVVLALLAERQSVPIVQVDVFARGDVAPVLARLDPGEAVEAALAGLSPARREVFAGPPFGAALAGGASLARAQKAVSVAAVGPRRLRIRVASADVPAARAVAQTLHASLAAAGLEERFSIHSASSGGFAALVLWAASALFGALLLARGTVALLGAARTQRFAVTPMRGAAPI